MADLPSRQELFARGRAAALAVPGTQISPAEIDRDGSDANLIIAAGSLIGEEVVNRQANQLAGCFEDTAKGPALDRIIFDRKQLPRLQAAPAVGSFLMSRPTNAGGAGTIQGGAPGSLPQPTRIQNQTGIVYVITQSIVWGALDLGPKAVPVQAELDGLAYEVDVNQTWSFIDAPFDTTLVITNTTQNTAGASDEETDEDYKARAKAFFPTVRRGTLGAIQFGLLSTPGIASVSLTEVVNAAGLPACSVQAFVLDALGNSNASLATRGLLNLLDFRAAGIPVVVLPGKPLFINVRILLTFFASLITDTVAAELAVQNAIVRALNNQLPGQTLRRATIIAAAQSVLGVDIADTALIAPAGDLIAPSPDVAFRTKQELIATT